MNRQMAQALLRPLLTLALLMSAPLLATAGELFLIEMEDLPLAPGLTEAAGGLLFESADGRIVEASATGEVKSEQVRKFYETSLHQLGWQSIGPLQFRRDNEVLRIHLDGSGPILTVHFVIKPASS